MAEPDYIAQTGEARHFANDRTARRWFIQQRQNAQALGCNWPRMTFNDDHTRLLFEAWTERPKNQGEPRWQLAPTQEDTP